MSRHDHRLPAIATPSSVNAKAPRNPASSKTLPPPTPQFGRAGRQRDTKARKGRSDVREAFGDGPAASHYARASKKEHNRHESDSHDLAFSPRHVTRVSVVDNMLLSLDRVNAGSHFTSDEPGPFSTLQDQQLYTSRHARGRGHTYSSSQSAESNLRSEAAHTSNRPHHSRRSNSSSNFQFILPRKDSLQRWDDGNISARLKAFDTQRAAVISDRSTITGLGGRRKSSKSSGSSSIDFGRMAATAPWQSPVQRRSSGSDHGYGHKAINPASSPLMPTALSVNHARPLGYNEVDAAPTPTVFAGPRSRDHSPAKGTKSNARIGHIDLKENAHLNLLYSKKTDAPASPLRTTFGPGIIQPDVRKGSRDYSLKQASPNDPSALAATRASYEQDGPLRDRPGFFRRVFGSSRSNTLQPSDSHLPSRRPSNVPSSYNSFGIVGANGSASNTLTYPERNKALPEEPVDIPKDNTQGPVSKKPSSFFKRRKKSISENGPTQSLPPHLDPRSTDAKDNHGVELSPTSNLRDAMKPYLTNPVSPIRPGHDSDLAEYDAAFLAGYLARNESTIKPALIAKEAAARELESSNHHKNSRVRGYVHNDDMLRVGPNGSTLYESIRVNEKPLPINERTSSKAPNFPNPPITNETPNPFPSAGTVVKDEIETLQNTKIPIPPTQQALEGSNGSELSQSNEQNISVIHNDSGKTLNQTELKVQRSIGQMSPSREKWPPRNDSSNPNGMPLEPAFHEARVGEPERLPLPHDGASGPTPASESPMSDYKSASSNILEPQLREDLDLQEVPDRPQRADSLDPTVPIATDRTQAKMIFNGDEGTISKAKAAAWLGETEPARTRVRRAYMELFDWKDMSILAALRGLCSRLLLKGETQQVDRILDSFSTRWCACNPNHGFKATGTSFPCANYVDKKLSYTVTDVVHTISYSVLLLNTDLHMADIDQKMTRPQFTRNCLPTIRRVAEDAAPENQEIELNAGQAVVRSKASGIESPIGGPTSPMLPPETTERRNSSDGRRPTWRMSLRPSDLSTSEVLSPSRLATCDSEAPFEDCGPLVKAPFNGKISMWEMQVEVVLKDIYNSVRQQRLPLHGSEILNHTQEQKPPSTSLHAMTGGMLRRTPSMVSKAGSENVNWRGRLADSRLTTGRWASKTRSRPRLYPSSTVASSRTSFDDQSSAVFSPSSSSTWSKFSLGKTQTSMSMDSLGSGFPQSQYQKSIGFANAVSQAIIREEAVGGEPADESFRAANLLEDESLGLAGAPWAKEGIVKHKHHLDSVDKKAKDRNWIECFAVIEKGQLQLFSFSVNAKTLRQKTKNQKAANGVVGGGNWTENAEALGSFMLRQTIASALPPPGYSKARAHVWALSLPTGAVHLFQVGTPEIAHEFVTTANYWSARLSKEPLMGGVSNVEYGWGESLTDTPLVHVDSMPHLAANNVPRPSLQSSLRSSFDQGNTRPKMPGDKVAINDWTPPQQSMTASALMEVDQLRALCLYVEKVEDELQKHNEAKSQILLAVREVAQSCFLHSAAR